MCLCNVLMNLKILIICYNHVHIHCHVHVKISHVLHNKKRKKQTLTKEFRIPLFCPPKFSESKTERERANDNCDIMDICKTFQIQNTARGDGLH